MCASRKAFYPFFLIMQKLFLVLVLAVSSLCAVAQTVDHVMKVYRGGVATEFVVSEIDSIVFAEPDTLDVPSIVVPDVSYVDEKGAEAFLAGIYKYLSAFCSDQEDVIRTYCLPLLYENGYVTPLQDTNPNVARLWSNGYRVIAQANQLISALAPVSEPYARTYSAHAVAIRAYVYYNMCVMWGDLPFITRPVTLDNDDLYLPRTSIEDILHQMLDECGSCISFMRQGVPFGDEKLHNVFSEASVELLRAEMKLAFGFDVEEDEIERWTAEDPTLLIGGFEIYTPAYVEKLLTECRGIGVNQWHAGEGEDDYYGNWAAQLRTGLAKQYLRQYHPQYEHRLLLPLPNEELSRNINLIQNPGY